MVKNGSLVKTVNFKNPKYVGDPINAVRIFNEKEVDELIVLDIDATVEGREPDYRMIEHLSSECRMPLCYGGGITTSDQVERIVQLGVEKVAISSAAIINPRIIEEFAKRVGSQSVVLVMDIKKNEEYEVKIHNGNRTVKKILTELVIQMERCGAGEIVLNSIDNDGIMKGYDYKLIDIVQHLISIPLTVLGGAGSLQDVGNLINKYGAIGAAAGSLFVFKGIYRAVLINYPNRTEKEELLREYYIIP